MTQFFSIAIDHSQVKRKYVLNLNEESHKTPYNENMHNHQLFHEELFFFKIFNTFSKSFIFDKVTGLKYLSISILLLPK